MQTRKYFATLALPALAASTLLAGLLFASPAHAALTILPDCAKNQAPGSPAPGLDCVEKTFVAVANLIFAISGSAALLFFVIGGFMVLTSAGNDAKVTKGKEYLKNAVIGLFIIFTSAYIIDYGVSKLQGAGTPGGVAECTGQKVFQNGVEKCVKDCNTFGIAQDDGQHYVCTDTNKRANGTDGCFPHLCPGAENIICCPQ